MASFLYGHYACYDSLVKIENVRLATPRRAVILPLLLLNRYYESRDPVWR
jgi:hypothetical protein